MTKFTPGTIVAVVRCKHIASTDSVRDKLTVYVPSDMTEVVRFTKTIVVTKDGRYWSHDGRHKATPASKPESIVFLSIDPKHIKKAREAIAERKMAEEMRQHMAQARAEWLQRADVQLASRLSLMSYTTDQAVHFWLCLGKDRLRALVAELESVNAFDKLNE